MREYRQLTEENRAWFKNGCLGVTLGAGRVATVGRWEALKWIVAGLAEISCVGNAQSRAVPANEDVVGR